MAEVLGCHADNVGMLTQGPIIEFRKISNAALRAGADRGGPENAMLAELQFTILGFGEKPLDILVRDTRKEENLVKITLPREFGLPLGEAGVLDQFTKGEGAQRYNRDSCVRREGFEGFRGCWQGFCHGNAGKAAKADGGCFLRLGEIGFRAEVEVILGEAGGAAVFRDERMAVAEFAARLVKLETRTAGEPDSGDALMVEGGGELVESGHALATDGNQGIDGDKENAGSLAQTRLRDGRGHSTGMSQAAAEGKKKAGRRICPPLTCPAASAGAPLCFISCQTLLRWRPSANLPSGC